MRRFFVLIALILLAIGNRSAGAQVSEKEPEFDALLSCWFLNSFAQDLLLTDLLFESETAPGEQAKTVSDHPEMKGLNERQSILGLRILGKDASTSIPPPNTNAEYERMFEAHDLSYELSYAMANSGEFDLAQLTKYLLSGSKACMPIESDF